MFRNKSLLKLSQLYKSGVFQFCKKAIKDKSNTIQKPNVQILGQPTHNTHPHLLRTKNEITPLITREEYQQRRHVFLENLLKYLSRTKPDIHQHIIVIPSASKQYMSDKIPYVFRQNTDFLYLTGCLEPDSCLVLTATATNSCTTLFMREKDEHSELWDGPRTGPEFATEYFGVDQSLPIGELSNYLQSYLKTHQNSYLWYDYLSPTIQPNLHRIMVDYINHFNQKKLCESPKIFIHKQRLIKSPKEIELMQITCNIASDAIIKTIQCSNCGVSEHEIYAKVDYECRRLGAQYLAYPPVVAGGQRANYIHYINNNQIVNDGEMVLMDTGCEYGGYSSDITRTWPINGRFNQQQKILYEIVYETQLELIELCKHYPTLDSLFNSMCYLLGTRLQQAGLISKVISKEAMLQAAYQFCPHHVSHYLGMDVHDTSLIGRNIKIRPGMVITIEPGIYINHKHQVPVEFKGLGVRIEDDILITGDGPVVLTKNCPKTIGDIEKLAKK